MHLLHEHTAMLNVTDIGKFNISIRDASSDNFELKEKRSSNASILLMNPVASGDNMATDISGTQKIKEEVPPLVPCCEGRELQINADLVRSGLSAISVKHDGLVQSLSMSYACEKLQVPPGLMKHRNSFRCLHRPDLKRVPYLRRMTADELETLFRGYADLPKKGPKKENHKNILRVPKPPDEISKSKLEKTDVNVDDGNVLHPIPEMRTGSEDVPAGLRLHGARARLYTSILAGDKTGDQLGDASAIEDIDNRVAEDILPEDEIQLNEELQIILPPRCDDVTADSSTTSSMRNCSSKL
ncbi:uncharacterized protein LOC116778749 [Danaus plexippus]|uniref:Uncharacterized protein n=1 Tax=Danaus plexippus plexippus TaxID=278856 RepID=A0A212FKH9_DANPL|nr:uncharacterized protein LOC116778749 [Danaus plexippus plexippus]XP_061385967.1 uncharacterized protein LOC116778749 [Danaus plexippus]OWR54242.1 hypothetical protein KGM_215678 [Danaus plexippus plexippus]